MRRTSFYGPGQEKIYTYKNYQLVQFLIYGSDKCTEFYYKITTLQF